MHLTATDGTAFTLRVTGYQFPEAPAVPPEAEDWDANWLVVEGRLGLPDGRTATFTDPCLLTCEAQELAHWLLAAGAGGTPEPLGFLEPVLAFTLRRDDGVPTLEVTLAPEATPKWAPDPLGEGYVVRLAVADADLTAAAGAWTAGLRDDPRRAADGSRVDGPQPRGSKREVKNRSVGGS